ncbi:hypothetical protein BX285_3556 [Streptomyces sp. 1114.5]|uniref:hypothetical protein n=1 Tax=Streptomyces sp. 1114.5 TaxID=1938830 RepID=UPI000EB2ED4B|nr:hypothetical protein [Streptomyces sp. 1114.5]RKT19105.1 hypothetical protein BX285_3556 [Streptomyces sp. 1114.5]
MAQLRPFGPSLPRALRLLLLAALLLGIVTMHTLGHPTGGHGGREVAARQLPGHHAAGVPMTGAAEAESPAALAEAAATFAEAAATFAEPAAAVAEPAADEGMDPMTVCLAVLAGWTLVLLAAAGPLLRRSGDAAADVRARLLRAVRAQPPPGGGRILLNRLSVLRQ